MRGEVLRAGGSIDLRGHGAAIAAGLAIQHDDDPLLEDRLRRCCPGRRASGAAACARTIRSPSAATTSAADPGRRLLRLGPAREWVKWHQDWIGDRSGIGRGIRDWWGLRIGAGGSGIGRRGSFGRGEVAAAFVSLSPRGEGRARKCGIVAGHRSPRRRPHPSPWKERPGRHSCRL